MFKNKLERRDSEVCRFFDKRFEEISHSVLYNPHWERPLNEHRIEFAEGVSDLKHTVNGIYEDEILDSLPTGMLSKTVAPDGRRYIFVMTRLGLVVMYPSNSKNIRGSKIYMSCDARITNAGLRPVLWTIEDYAAVLGSPHGIRRPNDYIYRNIGQWLELTLRALASPLGRVENVKLISRERA